jgi:hypothetical protein
VLRAEFPFYPSKTLRGKNFLPPFLSSGTEFFPGRIFPKVNFPGQNFSSPVFHNCFAVPIEKKNGSAAPTSFFLSNSNSYTSPCGNSFVSSIAKFIGGGCKSGSTSTNWDKWQPDFFAENYSALDQLYPEFLNSKFYEVCLCTSGSTRKKGSDQQNAYERGWLWVSAGERQQQAAKRWKDNTRSTSSTGESEAVGWQQYFYQKRTQSVTWASIELLEMAEGLWAADKDMIEAVGNLVERNER